MQTWLDAYTYEAGDAAIAHALAEIRAGRMPDGEGWRRASVVEAAVASLTHTLRAGEPGQRAWVDLAEFAIPVVSACLPRAGGLVRLRDAGPSPVSCLRPDRALVESLSAARAPAGQGGAVRAALASAFHYIDLPLGALALGDSGLELRAVLTRPEDAAGMAAVATGAAPSVLRLAAVLCARGSSRPEGVLIWRWGEAASAYCELSVGGVDLEVARAEVEDFLTLLALYRSVAASAQRGALPHASPGAIAANPRRERQRRRKFSMFRVETLAPPPDRFGRARGEGATWRLGWRSTVRGHFRWQPHGPGRELRRLVWIDEHARGPGGAPSKLDLHVVR